MMHETTKDFFFHGNFFHVSLEFKSRKYNDTTKFFLFIWSCMRLPFFSSSFSTSLALDAAATCRLNNPITLRGKEIVHGSSNHRLSFVRSQWGCSHQNHKWFRSQKQKRSVQNEFEKTQHTSNAPNIRIREAPKATKVQCNRRVDGFTGTRGRDSIGRSASWSSAV